MYIWSDNAVNIAQLERKESMKKLNIFLIGLLLVAQNILGPISSVSAETGNENAPNADVNETNDNMHPVDLGIPMDSDTNDDTGEDITEDPVSEEDETKDSDENNDSAKSEATDHDESEEEADVDDANTDEEISTEVGESSEDADEEDNASLFLGVIEEAEVNFSKLVVNGIDIVKPEDAQLVEPKIGDNVSVHYTFEIKDPKVDYDEGSTFSFELPSALLVFDAKSLSGEFTDDGVKFKYSTVGNTVTVELIEGIIEEGSHYSGSLNFHAKFGLNGAGEGLEQTVRIPIAGGQELKFYFTFKPSASGEAISKEGTAKIEEDGKRYIEWELWVNKAGAKLANAKVEDQFGEGHELDSDITVERYAIGLSGVDDKIDSKTVVNRFPVTLDDGYYAYKLTYKSLVTRVVEQTTESFTNNATLTNGDKTSTAKATATHTYGTKLEKSLVDRDKYKLKWSIKYNYFGSKFDSKTLTDRIEGNHKIIENTIKVYSVSLDSSGDGKKGDLVSPEPSAIVAPDGKSFTIDLKSPNGEAYLIEYETESTEEFVTGSGNIINEVQYDEEKAEENYKVEENIFHKSRASIDYDKKEITWSIHVNVERDMKNFVIEDLFKSYDDDGTRQTLVNPDNNPFTFSEGAPNYSDYKLIEDDPTKGFTLNYGDLAKGTSFTITYKTKFDILPNGTAYGEYKNTAIATWEGETTKDEGWKIEKSAQYNPGTSPTGNNGYKYGSFDHVNQVFNWTVGVNINKQQINGSTLVDEIGDGHKLVPGTIKVHKLQLEGNDWGNPVGNDLASEFNIEENNDLDGFTINFNKDTTDAYIITYQTKDDDNIIGQPDGSNRYENEATFTAIDDKTFDLKASVSIQNANELVSKSQQTNPDDETITWTIDVNKSHSTLGNIILTDIMSDNQLILPETFQKREILMNVAGTIGHGDWESIDPSTLKINHEENSFELDLGELDGKGYQIQYKTFFLGAHLDKFSNKASINYQGEEKGIEKESGVTDQEYSHNQSDGEISSKKGTLEIHKVGFNQLTGEQVNLKGITFHLYNKSGTVKLAEAITDEDGKLAFENVRYGKYKLKEVEGTPEGYIPLDQNGIDVTINDETNMLEDGESVEVINHEDVDLENACKLFKVTVKDADGKSLPENTEVTISNGNLELIKTTSEHGEIHYEFSELPAGLYKVFIDDVEYGEVQVSYEGDICEDEVQIAPFCEFFTVTIYNADKKPHVGADISIKENQDGEVIASGITNSNGEIEIESIDLPAGKYEVYEGQTKIGEIAVSYVDGDCEAVVNMLPVVACEVFTVTIKDADGKPVAETEIVLVRDDKTVTKTTDENGQITFAYGEIEAGIYEVQLEDSTIDEIDVSFAGEDCNNLITIAPNIPNIPGEPNVPSEPTCPIFEVIVKDADGNAHSNSTITIKDKAGNTIITAETDKNGKIRVPSNELPAGTYKAYKGDTFIGEIEVSHVDNCETEIQLAPTCKLFTITVNNADGKPQVKTEVTIIVDEESITKTTDENGQFTFEYGDIEAGAYEVQLDGTTIGEIDVSFAGEECVDEIQIAPSCPFFEVTVKDENGKERSNATVTIKDKDGNDVYTAKTNEKGEIHVPSNDLPAGNYDVYEGDIFIGEIEISYLDNCEAEVQASPSCPMFTLTITDHDKKPIAGLEIVVKDAKGEITATGKTDENGEVIFDQLVIPGNYFVSMYDVEIGEFTVSPQDCLASIALEENVDKPVTPGKPVDPVDPKKPTESSTSNKNSITKIGSKLPQTGEELFTYMIALGVLFLAGGTFILFRQRKRFS